MKMKFSSSPLVTHPETSYCTSSVTRFIETKVDALKFVDLTPNWILNLWWGPADVLTATNKSCRAESVIVMSYCGRGQISLIQCKK